MKFVRILTTHKIIAMIRILSKDSIIRFIIPHLSKARRGFICQTHLSNVVNAIFYKFRTGCQWTLLPIKSLIPKSVIKWGAVYHHFRKWTLDGSWKRIRKILARYNPWLLDLSLAHFDGTHTRATKGGKQVSYQRRKRARTTNTLWLTDRNGLVVSYLPPVSGRHNDLYEIEQGIGKLFKELEQMWISVDGLFVNADAGFDCEPLRHLCESKGIHLNVPKNKRNTKNPDLNDWYFDELMYEERYVVERTNAWMDNHRNLSVRHDTSIESWTAWHDLYCIFAWIKKIQKV